MILDILVVFVTFGFPIIGTIGYWFGPRYPGRGHLNAQELELLNG